MITDFQWLQHCLEVQVRPQFQQIHRPDRQFNPEGEVTIAVVGKYVGLQDAYQVEGTPALGVAGRYYVGGQGPRTLLVADSLIAEVRKG